MKIRDIYFNKRKCFVSLIIASLCIVVTVISFIFPDMYTSLAYAYPIKYPWQLLTGVFLHGSPVLSTAGSIGHLLFNLLLVLPFGIMVEKVIGSKKFLIGTLFFWIINLIAFYVGAYFTISSGDNLYGAGISGVAFSYGIIGAYVLFTLFRKVKTQMFRQVSFYLLANIIIIMFIMINPYVAGIQSMIAHLIAVFAGIIYTFIIRKDIDKYSKLYPR